MTVTREASLKQFHLLAKIVFLYSCAIMLSGATVRLSGSGLGCSRWPVCEQGELIGLTDTNASIESLNRVFTSLIAIPAALAVLAARRLDPRRRDLMIWAGLIVGSLLANAVLGGLSTIFELHPAIVGGHFVLALAVVGCALVLVYRSSELAGPPTCDPSFARLLVALFVAASIVVLTGVVVTGSGPHAGDAEAHRWNLDIAAAARIHSLVVWLAVALAIFVAVSSNRGRGETYLTKCLYRLIALCVVQGAIGYVQYFTRVPAWLVFFHIAGATAVWAQSAWTLLVARGMSDLPRERTAQ